MKWAILTLISIFWCMCCAQMLEWDSAGNLIAHSYSIWGDWSAHFTLISNMMERGLSWIAGDNPLYQGMPFQYPFLSHFMTAGLSQLMHLDVVLTAYLSSLALIFILPFALAYFFEALGLSARVSVISVILFLFIGGFQIFDSNLSQTEALTNQFQSGSVFTQIVLFELFPQRAFLFGILWFCFGLGFVYKKYRLKKLGAWQVILIAVLLAMMSWLHLHSWIAMGFLVWVAFWMMRDQSILKFGFLILSLSLPLIYFLLGRGTKTDSASWAVWFPGWAQNSNAGLSQVQAMNFVWFWIYNTGFFLPLVVIGFFKTAGSDDKILKILGLTGFLLFIMASTINFQPYFYDNLKIYTYSFLFLSPLAAIVFDRIFNKKYLIVFGFVFLSLQMATAVSDGLFFYQQKQSAGFFLKEEFEIAQDFKKIRSSPNALVLIQPRHNHWVTALAGNPVVMGYNGWLWSWAIQYTQREKEVNQILNGEPQALALIKKYGVDYVVIQEPVSVQYFGTHFKEVLSRNSWHVYQVK